MSKAKVIIVKENPITIIEVGKQDYISLTDMAKSIGDDELIYSWMRNRNTIEFIGIWEQLYNSNFKGNEFVTFKTQAELNNFTPSKWIEATAHYRRMIFLKLYTQYKPLSALFPLSVLTAIIVQALIQ